MEAAIGFGIENLLIELIIKNKSYIVLFVLDLFFPENIDKHLHW